MVSSRLSLWSPLGGGDAGGSSTYLFEKASLQSLDFHSAVGLALFVQPMFGVIVVDIIVVWVGSVFNVRGGATLDTGLFCICGGLLFSDRLFNGSVGLILC